MCCYHGQQNAKQMEEAVMRLFCSLEPEFMCDGMIGCDIEWHYEELRALTSSGRGQV